jgi:hypothetical protein
MTSSVLLLARSDLDFFFISFAASRFDTKTLVNFWSWERMMAHKNVKNVASMTPAMEATVM